jgi:hypothetical protein
MSTEQSYAQLKKEFLEENDRLLSLYAESRALSRKIQEMYTSVKRQIESDDSTVDFRLFITALQSEKIHESLKRRIYEQETKCDALFEQWRRLAPR